MKYFGRRISEEIALVGVASAWGLAVDGELKYSPAAVCSISMYI